MKEITADANTDSTIFVESSLAEHWGGRASFARIHVDIVPWHGDIWRVQVSWSASSDVDTAAAFNFSIDVALASAFAGKCEVILRCAGKLAS